MAGLEEKSAGLPVSRPAVMKVAPYKADWKGFWGKISSAVARGGGAYLTLQLAGLQEELAAAASTTAALTKFVEMVPELVASLATVQAASPGEKGYLLVKRALVAAIAELIEECASRKELHPPDAAFDTAALAEVLDGIDWVLASDFFERPRDVEILPPLKDALTHWLVAHQLSEPQARAVAERLPSYFVFALRDEWLERPELYKDVEASLKSPLMAATRQEQEWVRYEARLQRQIADRVFLETFSLEEIFIPLNVEYQEKDKAAERSPLDATLKAWLNSDLKTDFLRVLSGGPGSGKSSGAKKLAAEIGTTHGWRTLYIPLGDVNLKGTLQASVLDYLERHPNLPTQHVLEPNGKDRVLLFLDGLDEVGMRGTEARQVAQRFVEEVTETLRALNQDTRRVLAIIGGRPVVIGDNESRFNRHGKILHLLPYDETQRQNWWVKYGQKKGKGYENIPQPLAVETLKELTSQPLLNYLVALSYERGKVDFSREHIRVAVYEDLLTQVHERVWSPEDGNVQLKDLSYDDFTALLEQVALAAWHSGDTRQAKLGAIIERLKKNGLLECLDILATKSNDGLLRLLAAFYLGVSGTKLDDPETDVEFTHKSFGDYLVARHIVGFLELMQGERDRRTHGPRGSGWDDDKCLDEWVERFGPSAMNFDLLNWTIDTVGYREKYPSEAKGQTIGTAATWQKTIALLLSDVLHKGVPMERVEPRPSYKEEDRQARNVEESFCVILHCCSQVSEVKSILNQPMGFSMKSFIERLYAHKSRGVSIYSDNEYPIEDTGHNLITKCLNSFLLKNIIMHCSDFGRIDFSYNDFSGSFLAGSNFIECKLLECKMNLTNLFGVNFFASDISFSDMKSSAFTNAKIFNVNIRGTDFRGARDLETAMGWESVEGFDEAIFDPDIRQKLEAIRAQAKSLKTEEIEEAKPVIEENSDPPGTLDEVDSV